ncbi:AAEL017089-PA [Aedes aegypti]|uniref:AAEL017089-PA n=1 Tax=Aedes aegypti TaxID=7159 RepID=J9HFY7_AEDAE|nr:AAEL017089-PA [Aedes aegypti]
MLALLLRVTNCIFFLLNINLFLLTRPPAVLLLVLMLSALRTPLSNWGGENCRRKPLWKEFNSIL